MEEEGHEPLWIPFITAIETPFQAISNAAELSLKREPPLEGTRSALKACAAMAKVQDTALGEYTNPDEIDPDKVRGEIRAGRKALGDNRLIPPKEPFTGLFQELVSGLEIEGLAAADIPGRLAGLIEKAGGHPKGLKDLPEYFTDELGLVTGIDPNILSAVFHAARQVFAVAEAEQIRPHVERELWDLPTCPICGSNPEMGRIETSEGHLYLVCPLCFTEWKHIRLKCPWCGCEGQDKLGYFTADEYPGYRVNVCRNCSGYLKITVEKILNKRHVPVVFNLLTLELDLQAEREGFHLPLLR